MTHLPVKWKLAEAIQQEGYDLWSALEHAQRAITEFLAGWAAIHPETKAAVKSKKISHTSRQVIP